MKIIIPELKNIIFSLHRNDEVKMDDSAYAATAARSHKQALDRYAKLNDYKIEIQPMTVSHSPQDSYRSFRVGENVRLNNDDVRTIFSSISPVAKILEVVETTIDLTSVAQKIDSMFDSIVLPDGIKPMIYPSSWRHDLYKISRSNTWSSQQYLDLGLALIYTDRSGHQRVYRGEKNSQAHLELECSLKKNDGDALLFSGNLKKGAITQKMIDYSLRSLDSAKAGFAEGLAPKQISAMQDKLEVLASKLSQQYQALYGREPEPEDLAVLFGVEGERSDDPDHEED